MSRRNRVSALAIALVACGEGSTAPSRYLVYDRDSASGEFRLGPVEIATLEDPRIGNGAIAELRGGGKIVLGTDTPSTEEDFRSLILVEGHDAPDIQFEVDDKGVAVPFDFESALMLSLYHHLERASDHFAARGVALSEVRKLPVYYSPELFTIFSIPLPVFTDNAAYGPTFDGFLIPPTFFLRDVPLVANRGVIIHEYSHAVFNRLAHEDRRVPRYFVEDWPRPAINELRSLDEGLADIHASFAVNDPNFISASIAKELFDIDRDVSVDRIYDEPLRNRVLNDRDGYNPYPLGSVIASVIWDLQGQLPADQLGDILIGVQRALAPLDDRFELVKFFDLLYDALPAGARASACRLFHERLEAVRATLACKVE